MKNCRAAGSARNAAYDIDRVAVRQRDFLILNA